MGYSVEHVYGLPWLREVFGNDGPDALNFCLFSTSGIHGSNGTIEDAEDAIKDGGADPGNNPEVTFLVVQPRTVNLFYGNATCNTMEDIEFLKRLRAASRAVVSQIGYPF